MQSINTLTPKSSAQTISSPPTCTYCGSVGHDYDRCYQRICFLKANTRSHGRGHGNHNRGGGAFSGLGQQGLVMINNVIASSLHDQTTLFTAIAISHMSIPGPYAK